MCEASRVMYVLNFMFTYMQELGEMAFAYVSHADLTKGAPDQRSIVLDNVLCDALFKGVSDGYKDIPGSCC